MKRTTIPASAASVLTFAMMSPAFAQEEVDVLSNWAYDDLYADGRSVETMLDATEVIDAKGEDIGDIENIIFSNEGEVLGIIAQVGGPWEIGDTHVHVPWDEVTLTDSIQQLQVPVTEDTVEDYDIFFSNWGDQQLITEAGTDTTRAVDDDLFAGSGIFKATDLIGSYAYLSENVRYGYIADIIVKDNAIAAIVADATAYGRGGYYAYPYGYDGISPMGTVRYDFPYGAAEIDTIEAFDYEQLQSNILD